MVFASLLWLHNKSHPTSKLELPSRMLPSRTSTMYLQLIRKDDHVVNDVSVGLIRVAKVLTNPVSRGSHQSLPLTCVWHVCKITWQWLAFKWHDKDLSSKSLLAIQESQSIRNSDGWTFGQHSKDSIVPSSKNILAIQRWQIMENGVAIGKIFGFLILWQGLVVIVGKIHGFLLILEVLGFTIFKKLLAI